MNISDDLKRVLESKVQLRVYEAKLAELSGKDKTFVVIGACDGVTHDRLYPFSSKNPQWKGLLVEPIKEYLDRVQTNYSGNPNLSFENSAVSDENGETVIYKVDPQKIDSGELPDWTRGISTLDETTYWITDPRFRDHVVTEKIVTKTFETIAEEHSITDIDILQIDAEGYDSIILKQVLGSGFRPYLMFFEANHLPLEDKYQLWQMLMEMGYNVYPSTDWTCVRK